MENASSAPVQIDQEWANATTHGFATVTALIASVPLVTAAFDVGVGMGWATVAYAASVVGTFFSSALSHTVLTQPWLNRLRAYDQAMIFAMIVGTYTPIVWAMTPRSTAWVTIVAMWAAAAWGMLDKAVRHRRINDMTPWPYLALGWAPAIVMTAYAPWWVAGTMLTGGLAYCGGVWFLMNDTAGRYFHAVWHLFVMSAAAIHGYGIWQIINASNR